MHRSPSSDRVRASALAALATYAFLAPALAWAAQTPHVWVVDFGAADASTEKLAAKLVARTVEELKARKDVAVGGAVGAPAAAPSVPTKEATDALAEGAKLLDELRFEEAAAAFKKGIELEEADPATADFKAIGAALVKEAGALFRLGEEKKAQAVLVQMARLNPSYDIPQGQFPPVFFHEFEKIRRRVEHGQRGGLAVEGALGAQVFLDGRPAGTVPAQLMDLPAGGHFLKVEGLHGERLGLAVEVRAGVAHVRAAFPDAVVAAFNLGAEIKVGPTVDADLAAAAAKVCASAELDYLLVAFVRRSAEHRANVAPALYSASAHGFAKLTPFEVADDGGTPDVEAFHLAEAVAARIQAFGVPEALPFALKANAAADAPVANGPPETKVRPLEHPSVVVNDGASAELRAQQELHGAQASKSWPWWVWAIGGAVVAGAAAGGIYAIAQSSKPATGSAAVNWP